MNSFKKRKVTHLVNTRVAKGLGAVATGVALTTVMYGAYEEEKEHQMCVVQQQQEELLRDVAAFKNYDTQYKRYSLEWELAKALYRLAHVVSYGQVEGLYDPLAAELLIKKEIIARIDTGRPDTIIRSYAGGPTLVIPQSFSSADVSKLVDQFDLFELLVRIEALALLIPEGNFRLAPYRQGVDQAIEQLTPFITMTPARQKLKELLNVMKQEHFFAQRTKQYEAIKDMTQGMIRRKRCYNELD